MCFVMISLLLLVSGLQHSEAWTASNASVLLQVRQLQSSRVQGRDDELIAAVHLLVDQVKHGRNLSDLNIVVESMMESLENSSFPALFKELKNDEDLLSDHAASVATCDAHFKQSHTDETAQLAQLSSLKADLDLCNSQLENLTVQDQGAQTELLDLLKRASPPEMQMPEPRIPGPAIADWVTQNLMWFSDFNQSYTLMKATLGSDNQAAAAQQAACALQRTNYEAKVCGAQSLASQDTAEYDQCYTASVALFKAAEATALDNAEHRKAEYTTLKQVECMLRMLMTMAASPASNNTVQFESCATAVVDTTMIDFKVPALPSQAAPFSSMLGELGNGVECSSGMPTTQPASLSAEAVQAGPSAGFRVACENPRHPSFPECTMSTQGTCKGTVILGYGSSWTPWKAVEGPFSCSNDYFQEDPAPGQAKECRCVKSKCEGCVGEH